MCFINVSWVGKQMFSFVMFSWIICREKSCNGNEAALVLCAIVCSIVKIVVDMLKVTDLLQAAAILVIKHKILCNPKDSFLPTGKLWVALSPKIKITSLIKCFMLGTICWQPWLKFLCSVKAAHAKCRSPNGTVHKQKIGPCDQIGWYYMVYLLILICIVSSGDKTKMAAACNDLFVFAWCMCCPMCCCI